MEVIPAVDIRGGKCVRLFQGDYARETVFDDDPVSVARRWASQGARRIHVVDLDGAREGRQANAETVLQIVEAVDCAVQAGGGIRDVGALRAALDAGVSRAVIGTAAAREGGMLREAVALAGDRLVVSVDALDGLLRLEGWTEATDRDAHDWVHELAAEGVERIVFTDIGRDGAMGGPNMTAYERLVAEAPVAVIAAGGVASVEDVRRLAACGVEAAIIGRALYTGDVDLAEAIEAAR